MKVNDRKITDAEAKRVLSQAFVDRMFDRVETRLDELVKDRIGRENIRDLLLEALIERVTESHRDQVFSLISDLQRQVDRLRSPKNAARSK